MLVGSLLYFGAILIKEYTLPGITRFILFIACISMRRIFF